ncbi:MAG: zinc-dependent peptidase, partial [Verrucomicrobiota bacterium]|nr:zinc-dependent peptidase [Verrucomicrobiota bacterium]
MAITSHLAPVPPGFKPRWRDLLEKNVAIYRRLPEDLTLVVEELIPWFIEKVDWEWSHWAGPSPEKELHQVCVACEACLLIARRSKKDYSHFKKFIFFPADLAPVKKKGNKAAGDASSYYGQIRQGWYWTKEGMEDGGDNYNVTIHEFAHMLDYRSKEESVPYFEHSAVKQEYKSFLKEEYRDICRAWEEKTNTEVIRKYATKEKSEFFTCATEAFFERSEMLCHKRRELYKWMKQIYGMHPAQWPARVSSADLQRVRYDGLASWQSRASWETEKDSLPRWPDGISAEGYDPWREGERERRYSEERKRTENYHAEKRRRELLRLAQEKQKAGERERKNREHLERRERLKLEQLKRKSRERQ